VADMQTMRRPCGKLNKVCKFTFKFTEMFGNKDAKI
jgi:hypothetical protein